MTAHDQNAAIARALGMDGPLCSGEIEGHDWGECQEQEKPVPFSYRRCRNCAALHFQGENYIDWDKSHVCPDFTSDLNDCAIMERALTDEEIAVYMAILYRVVGVRLTNGGFALLASDERKFLCATAPQRCEAWLRSRGLWTTPQNEPRP